MLNWPLKVSAWKWYISFLFIIHWSNKLCGYTEFKGDNKWKPTTSLEKERGNIDWQTALKSNMSNNTDLKSLLAIVNKLIVQSSPEQCLASINYSINIGLLLLINSASVYWVLYWSFYVNIPVVSSNTHLGVALKDFTDVINICSWHYIKGIIFSNLGRLMQSVEGP